MKACSNTSNTEEIYNTDTQQKHATHSFHKYNTEKILINSWELGVNTTVGTLSVKF